MSIPEQHQEKIRIAHEMLDELQNQEKEPETPEVEVTEPETPEVTEPEPQPAPLNEDDEWRKRYINYKKSTDKTIYSLRQETAALKSSINILQEKLDKVEPIVSEYQSMQHDKVKSELSDELGEDTAKVLDSYIDKVMSPLKAENEELKQKLDTVENITTTNLMEKSKSEKINLVRSAVGADTFDRVDNDPNFTSYLQQYDHLSGSTIQELVQTAVATNNLSYVVSVYQQFAQSQVPQQNAFEAAIQNANRQPNPEPDTTTLDKRAIPSDGGVNPETQPEKRIWSRSEIKQFYLDKANNRLSKQVADELSQDIKDAVNEGRIR